MQPMREEAKSPAAEPSASERDEITSEQRVCFNQSVFALWEFLFSQNEKSRCTFLRIALVFRTLGFLVLHIKRQAVAEPLAAPSVC